MIEKWLDVEGPVIGFLDKVGQLILLGICWFLGCVPLITIGTSSTALYYAVIKSIRREQGDAIREFWKSYKANLKRGISVTVAAAILGGVLTVNLEILQRSQGQKSSFLAAASLIALFLLAATGVYICPILSRFTMKVTMAWKLAFVMALRYFLYTAIIIMGSGMLVGLQIYVFPIPTVVLIPGFWCYGTTFLIERALQHYMPSKRDNDNAWYYE